MACSFNVAAVRETENSPVGRLSEVQCAPRRKRLQTASSATPRSTSAHPRLVRMSSLPCARPGLRRLMIMTVFDDRFGDYCFALHAVAYM